MIDEIIKEPRGGAHRNHDQIANNVLEAIKKHLRELLKLNKEELVYLRNNRYLSIGRETLLSKDEFYKTQEIDRPYEDIFNWRLLFTNNIRLIQFVFVFLSLFVIALILL